MPTSTNIILLFLKSPRRGTVKTRLASHVGADQATAVYKALVERQISAFTGLGDSWEIHVQYTPTNDLEAMRDWLGKEMNYQSQSDGDLGDRLESACGRAFQRGARYVYCIGGDCPSLTAIDLLAAQKQLDDGFDVAVGPCEDGGYYLLATRDFRPELFRGIPWSESNTLEETIKVAKDFRLSVSQLDEKYDIDEFSELQRAIAEGLLPESLLA